MTRTSWAAIIVLTMWGTARAVEEAGRIVFVRMVKRHARR
jgi:hypothetical protein